MVLGLPRRYTFKMVRMSSCIQVLNKMLEEDVGQFKQHFRSSFFWQMDIPSGAGGRRALTMCKQVERMWCLNDPMSSFDICLNIWTQLLCHLESVASGKAPNHFWPYWEYTFWEDPKQLLYRILHIPDLGPLGTIEIIKLVISRSTWF